MQIKLDESNTELKEKLKQHHNEADLAYVAQANDKEASKTDPAKKTVTFDMQQCLPTPLVESSLAFYKRQLWTFNLTIHDCDEDQAFCYMWHEALAKRGGDDVGSCLYYYILNHLPKTVKHLTLYSDTCGGQNKNSYVAAMFMKTLQDSETLETIDHKFFVAGHTRMECDADHSVIEKKKKKYSLAIEHPHDWAQLVRLCGKKKPFIVHEMRQCDFLAFSNFFKGPLVNRKLNENHNWRFVKWLHFEKKQSGVLFYKTSLTNTDEFQRVDFRRKFGKETLSLTTKQSYNGPNPVSSEKKSNLLDLLPFIGETYREFYINLKTTNHKQTDVYPDASSDESDD